MGVPLAERNPDCRLADPREQVLGSRTAVVVGGYGEIGLATATELANLGVKLALFGRKPDELERAADALRDSLAGRPLILVGDAREPASVASAFDEALGVLGHLDIVVNAAGVGRRARISDGDYSLWRELWETNVIGAGVVAREALRRFEVDRGGDVVFVSSTSAHRLHVDGGFYSVTKNGLRALVEVLRQELAASESPHRITAISPGRVETAFFRQDQDPVPFKALRAADVAGVIVRALESPRGVVIADVILRAPGQLQ